jgi:hypothetical protein
VSTVAYASRSPSSRNASAPLGSSVSSGSSVTSRSGNRSRISAARLRAPTSRTVAVRVAENAIDDDTTDRDPVVPERLDESFRLRQRHRLRDQHRAELRPVRVPEQFARALEPVADGRDVLPDAAFPAVE